MKRKSGTGGGYWPKLYRAAWGLLSVLAVIGVVSLFYPQYAGYAELQRREANLQEECRQAQARTPAAQERSGRPDQRSAFVERVAREEFGLAKPGESVIKFIEDQPNAAR